MLVRRGGRQAGRWGGCGEGEEGERGKRAGGSGLGSGEGVQLTVKVLANGGCDGEEDDSLVMERDGRWGRGGLEKKVSEGREGGCAGDGEEGWVVGK